VNVGGHRTFRPAELARRLEHLGLVNIGAAGTFVVRKHVSPTALRAELAEELPFQTEIMICRGREVLDLISRNYFTEYPERPDLVRFVSVLHQAPPTGLSIPFSLPPAGRWLVRIVAREKRMVLGVYRRHMKTIGHLGKLDRLFGSPVTTRNWNTITAIAKTLEAL